MKHEQDIIGEEKTLKRGSSPERIPSLLNPSIMQDPPKKKREQSFSDIRRMINSIKLKQQKLNHVVYLIEAEKQRGYDKIRLRAELEQEIRILENELLSNAKSQYRFIKGRKCNYRDQHHLEMALEKNILRKIIDPTMNMA
jgi:hypothetical protein